MLKRDITYENPLTGEKVTETHHFHISKTDMVEMEIEHYGRIYTKDGEELTGMRAQLQRIMDAEDGKAIMVETKDLIRRSYGVNDNGRWRKTKELADDFMSSEAYSQLFWELCTQPEAMGDFFNGVIPANLEQVAAEVQEQAEKIRAGIEAQEKAKAAGAGHPSDPVATPVEPAPTESEPGFVEPSLASRIDAATVANPAILTQAEMVEIDSDTLKSGLATGRIKLT